MIYYIFSIIIVLLIVGNISRRIGRRGKVISITEENCIGCRRCVKKCRRNVLEMIKEEKGIQIIVKSPERCTACGDCVSACKFNALEIIKWQEKPL